MANAVKRIYDKYVTKWNQYKYRFVPWIALNLKERSVRSVPDKQQDNILSSSEVLSQLQVFFAALNSTSDGNSEGVENVLRTKQCIEQSPAIKEHDSIDMYEIEMKRQEYARNNPTSVHKENLHTLFKSLGFQIERKPSVIKGGGTGVLLTKGQVNAGRVVALYPGCIYRHFEPIFFQSIKNPFIFRCIDGVLVDGNDKGISKLLFRSCGERDRVGPYTTCDASWLSPFPRNPMAIGQYVNNHNKEYPANVAYQEIDIPVQFPFHLRKYIPNVYHSARTSDAEEERLMRMVVLISTRKISQGEELFSSYFTVVHQ